MSLHIGWHGIIMVGQCVILPAFTQCRFGLDAFPSEFGRYRPAVLLRLCRFLQIFGLVVLGGVGLLE